MLLSPPSLAAAASSLADLAREGAEQAEKAGRVAPEFIEELRRSGLAGCTLPASAGGAGTEVADLLEALRLVATGDGSAGWVAMIYSVTAAVAHHLPGAAITEVFGSGASTLAAGVLAPRGSAQRVPGGYLLSGRWPFASGCLDASWLSLGAMLEDGTVRSFLVPMSVVTVHDNWDVMGLRASASHDVEVADTIVPDRLVFDLGSPPRTAEPVGRFPIYGLLAAGIGAVCLGIAEAAIVEMLELSGAKIPTGSKRRLIDRPSVQEAVARAMALVGSARAYLLSQAGRAAVDRPEPGQTVSLEERARLRLAATLAVDSARQAVDLMYTAGGGTSLYARSPLQRHFRDVHTATQHMMVAQPTWELAGKVLAGIEADSSNL